MASRMRIVSLISSATEILYLLGLGEQVVGISHECDYPRQVADKRRLTRSLVDACATSQAIDQQVRELTAAESALYTIDVPALEALRPDLIVTQAQCDVCAVRYADVLAAVAQSPILAGTQIVALNPLSLDDVFADIERLAAATGVEAAGQHVLMQLRQRVRSIRETTRALAAAQRPRVACLEWIEPPMLAANWMPPLVELAGGQCHLTQAGHHSTYIDRQTIVAFDPQVLVIMPCGFDLPRAIAEAQILPGWDGWQELSAVRDNRVFAVDGNAYFNRSGPRLVESLSILSHLVQPGLFAPPVLDGARPWNRLTTSNLTLTAETV